MKIVQFSACREAQVQHENLLRSSLTCVVCAGPCFSFHVISLAWRFWVFFLGMVRDFELVQLPQGGRQTTLASLAQDSTTLRAGPSATDWHPPAGPRGKPAWGRARWSRSSRKGAAHFLLGVRRLLRKCSNPKANYNHLDAPKQVTLSLPVFSGWFSLWDVLSHISSSLCLPRLYQPCYIPSSP